MIKLIYRDPRIFRRGGWFLRFNGKVWRVLPL